MSTVYVDVRRSSSRWPRRRPQRWTWRATAPNGRVMADSAESYVNRSACVHAVHLLFGERTDVTLRQPGLGDVTLRLAVNR